MPSDSAPTKSSYPLPVYNYRVSVENIAIGFSEVSGLTVEYQAVTYKHGLSFLSGDKIIPGMRQPVRLTMKRGIMTGSGFLADWFRDAHANTFSSAKKDILVDLCDESGNTVIRWKVRGALPVKLNAPAFDAKSNEVAVESLELVAHDIQIDFQPN
jgi:phage tail-like protein